MERKRKYYVKKVSKKALNIMVVLVLVMTIILGEAFGVFKFIGEQTKALAQSASGSLAEMDTSSSGDKELIEAEELKRSGVKDPASFPIMKELDSVTSQILTDVNKDNSLGYPVDENFFLWFYHRYGEQTYRSLADCLEQGYSYNVYQKLTGNTLHVLWIYYCAETGLHEEYLKNVYLKEGDGSTDIVMDFTGDINLDPQWGNVKEMLENGESITDCLTDGLVNELKSADLTMINNEFAYANEGTPLEGKKFTFKANENSTQMLKEIGVDIVSLANNHVFDYGEEGLKSTFAALKDAKIPYIGAGNNLDEAGKIVYFVINGKKIAYTAGTQIERTTHYTKAATENSAGVMKCLNPKQYCKVIEEAKENADFVIAFVHWGTEGREYYEQDQINLAKAFVKSGANAIIGGHTHCLQGVSYIEDVPIFYSMGNFWFDWSVNNSKATGVAQITLHEDGSFDCRFLPCYYSKFKTQLITDDVKKDFLLKDLYRKSEGIQIDSDGYITKDES